MRRLWIPFVLALALSCPIAAAADTVIDWNQTMLTVTAGQNPFAQARSAAITQLAVFEAVNACTKRYRPYLGTVTAPRGASPDAAAAAAAHGVLSFYFPSQAALLNAKLAESLALIPEGQSKWDGIAVGEAAAGAMIAHRAADGAAPPETFLPSSIDPGVWQTTPPAFGPGALLHWRNLTTFGIARSDQFRSAPPPALTSKVYARDHREVKRVGAVDSASRPQHRSDVATFFAAASAAHAWNLGIQQVAAAKQRSLTFNARVFALLNMAISDGLVASMETKYHYLFWRPVTAIRAGDTDGNAATGVDAGWTPLLATPSFPSYPSAHASASYAARAVAERFFPFLQHGTFTLTHPGAPGVTLTYRSFRALTEDIDDARVYGGIHFRFDQVAGAIQGYRVGWYIHTRWLGRDW
jgi:hypothetical protein